MAMLTGAMAITPIQSIGGQTASPISDRPSDAEERRPGRSRRARPAAWPTGPASSAWATMLAAGEGHQHQRRPEPSAPVIAVVDVEDVEAGEGGHADIGQEHDDRQPEQALGLEQDPERTEGIGPRPAEGAAARLAAATPSARRSRRPRSATPTAAGDPERRARADLAQDAAERRARAPCRRAPTAASRAK